MRALLKRLINSIYMPNLIYFFISKDGKTINPTWEQIKKDSPDPKNNWFRLGMPKYGKYFAPAIIIISLYWKAKIIEFSLNLLSKFDVLSYSGTGSPLTIVYQTNAWIYLIDNGLTLVGIAYLFYFGYKLFKR